MDRAAAADEALRRSDQALRQRHRHVRVLKLWQTVALRGPEAERCRARAHEVEAWTRLAHWSGSAADARRAAKERRAHRAACASVAAPSPDTEPAKASPPQLAESEDAVFEIELSETRRVVASTEGSGFDTVVSLWSGGEDAVCEGGIGPFDSDELRQCRDRVSLPRVVDRDLPAGTHWVVVDGWDTTSRGSYELDIAVLEP